VRESLSVRVFMLRSERRLWTSSLFIFFFGYSQVREPSRVLPGSLYWCSDPVACFTVPAIPPVFWKLAVGSSCLRFSSNFRLFALFLMFFFL